MDPWFIELMTAVKAGGAVLGPVFALLWWRSEARLERMTEAKDKLLERVIVSMEGTRSALEALEKLFDRKSST